MALATLDESTATIVVDAAPTTASQASVAEAITKAELAITQSTGATKKYTHTQSTSSATWNVNHNLGTSDICVSVYSNTGQSLSATIQIVDANNITITLLLSGTGKAVVVG